MSNTTETKVKSWQDLKDEYVKCEAKALSEEISFNDSSSVVVSDGYYAGFNGCLKFLAENSGYKECNSAQILKAVLGHVKQRNHELETQLAEAKWKVGTLIEEAQSYQRMASAEREKCTNLSAASAELVGCLENIASKSDYETGMYIDSIITEYKAKIGGAV